MRRLLVVCMLGVAAVANLTSHAARGADSNANEPLLGPALRTLFNPRAAPTQKSMGLLQRSFLDLVEESRPKLQIAFVIDGTDSMSGQLENVRQSLTAMMNDLDLYRESNITYQLVVYRDVGAPSGEIVMPLQVAQNGFTSDREAIAAAIGKVKAESGAPYFPELVDVGLHEALTQLDWATDDDTSRWILLFGDAPPFDESFDEPQNKARRQFGSGALVSLAAEKGVRISCVLCTSDSEDREPHDKLLDQTRKFMNTMSSKTGGLMLDLSYDDIRAAVRQAAPKQAMEYEKIGAIRAEDVEEVRRQIDAEKSPLAAGRRLRVAILPHLPLDQMSFEPQNEAVQLATELRIRFRELPGVEFKDPATIKDRFRRISNQGVQGEALLQLLATVLNVDYVIWGTFSRTGGAVEATTGIYDQASGSRLARTSAATNPTVQTDQLGAVLAGNLIKSHATMAANHRLKLIFASLAQDPARSDALVLPVALGAARSPLLEGMEALEQSLATPVGVPEGAEALENAAAKLQQAVDADAENPLARFLLANALFNQARARQQAGDVEGARKAMVDFAKQLREAFRLRVNRHGEPALRTEIEADHALLVRGNADEAIKLYRQLLDAGQGVDADASRRGYWMLAGIYAGDWGVDAKYVNREEAKQCMIKILAIWPDSSEAAFIRQALRWDEATGATRFPHYPKENRTLAEMVDHSA